MLSPDERALIRRDPGLPGLALLLDEAAFLELMRKRLPAAGLWQGRREYLRYKPAANLLVRYTLQGASGSISVYAKAYGSDAAVKLDKAGKRAVVPTALGPGRLVYPEQRVVVCAFPNDDKLQSLRLLATPAQRERLLQQLLPDQCQLQKSDLEVLRYKPERRFVACLRGTAANRALIKLYDPRGFALASRVARHFAVGDGAVFPRRIGSSKRHRILVSEWCSGQCLSDVYRQPGFDLAAIEQLGGLLAAFHQYDDGSALPRRFPGSEAAVLQALAEGVQAIAPALAADARSLARRLSRQLDALQPMQRTIHGDFYAGQVLYAADGLQLLDYDEVCMGHPAADVGLFLAHLERDALCGRVSRQRAAELESMFLQGYFSAADWTALAAVDLYTATGLMQLLHTAFRNCEADWSQQMAALLAAAWQRVERHEKSSAELLAQSNQPIGRVSVIDPEDCASDHSMPLLAAALDPECAGWRVAACLSNHKDNGPAPKLASISVLRHRTGRRCLLEYRFHSGHPALQGHPQSVIGKLRARGLDKHTWRLNQELYARDFAPGCADGIEIPEPIGTIPAFNMWLQRRVAGTSVYPLLSGRDGKSTAQRVATAIHKLHCANIPTDRSHGIEDELTILDSALAGVALERPDWRARLNRLLEICRRLGATLTPGVPMGIHRDFYHDQLLVNGRQLYLLDLDLYCRGDPALDIGNFIAHLQEQSLRDSGDIYALDDTVGVLIERYEQLAKRDLHASIEIYRLLTLVRLIAISRRIPGRRAFTEQLLATCEEQLLTSEYQCNARQ